MELEMGTEHRPASEILEAQGHQIIIAQRPDPELPPRTLIGHR